MLRFLVFLIALALIVPGAPSIAAAEDAQLAASEEGTLVAQSRRRRRRRRGRRSRAPKPPKKKKKKKKAKKKSDEEAAKKEPADSAKSDAEADAGGAGDEKKEDKKAEAAKKPNTARAKKKAPKVTEPEPLLPENFGSIVLYSGVGVTAIGLGVAGWGATVHNGAVSERHTLQDREANNANQMQAFYDLHSDMETGKLIHLTGLGIAGFGALAAAVGGLL